MTSQDTRGLLQRLPALQRVAVRVWMDVFDVVEEQLTVPLLQLLAAASAAEDDGVRHVLAALLEQERLQLSQVAGSWAGAAGS